jgi:hypothetical protein
LYRDKGLLLQMANLDLYHQNDYNNISFEFSMNVPNSIGWVVSEGRDKLGYWNFAFDLVL